MRRSKELEFVPENTPKCVPRGKEQANMKTCNTEQGNKQAKRKNVFACRKAHQSVCLLNRSLSVCPHKATAKGVQRLGGSKGARDKTRRGGPVQPRDRGKGEGREGRKRREEREEKEETKEQEEVVREGKQQRARERTQKQTRKHQPLANDSTENGA